MRAEHLWMWLRAATREEDPKPGNWEKVVAIIQVDFRVVELVAQFDLKTLVMIPKGGGIHFRGIGLIEFL